MRRVWKNLVSVVGGEAAVRAANFVAALLIARLYGGETLGVYAACLAVITVVVMFADNGLQTWAITQLSSADTRRNESITRIAICKTLLLLLAAIGLAGVCKWINLNALFWTTGIWVALRTALQSYSQLQMAALKAIARAHFIGAIQCTHSVLLFLLIGLAFEQRWTFFNLLAGMTACQAVEFALGLIVTQRAGLHLCWPRDLELWDTIKKATPYGIVFGLATLIVRLDTIVLSALVSLSELGSFSAANTVLVFVYVSSWLLGSILLPEMVKNASDAESLKRRVDKWARITALVIVPASVLASLAAPQLITVLFGLAFANSGAIAAAMALACPFIILNSVYTSLAIALKRRRVFVGVFAATALVTAALDYFFGRTFGARGVAWAIVLREVAMLFAFLLLLSRATFSAATRRPPVPLATNQEQLSERV